MVAEEEQANEGLEIATILRFEDTSKFQALGLLHL